MSESFLDGKVTLHRGDCLEVLPLLDENSIDSCVTDPPYHLTSIVKRFGAENAAPAKIGKTGAYERSSRGFMGKQWDGGDIAFRQEVWAEVLRVLKPGGHLLAFGGDRTYHRLAAAIEDAGFEVRGTIAYLFGSGFPKSLNVSARLADSLPADAQCFCAHDCQQTASAARFFYTAKADSDDRLGSKHPTVKPLDLMGYLVRLVTPKGGMVLDPFAGTGTTGEAAYREGISAVLIEREAEYQADIVKRMGLCLYGPDARNAATVKQLGHDDLPLFAEVSA